ncbi:STAS domain-containing protein [Candidatus Poriferisodalis sp.]|uniref:STAS domain-containing protein n=1 Tax=Candidatus Poriferisodalis sp. TaxID=3101277 RepID=UPI003B01BD97
MISGISERTVTAPDGSRAVVVTPRGELDLAAIASLDSALRSALATAGSVPRLVVDLSDVDVLQPVVLGVLLDVRRRCRTVDVDLVLLVTTPGVASTLIENEVDSLFDTASGLEAAIAGVTGR